MPWLLLFFFIGVCQAQLIFREDFRELPAEIPVGQKHVANANLILHRQGPGAAKIKKSHHPKIANDPHYVWSGLCEGAWALVFESKQGPLNLSGQGASVLVRTKQFQRELRLILVSGERYFVSRSGVQPSQDWIIDRLPLHELEWAGFDPETCTARPTKSQPDLSRVTHLGFTDLKPGGRSKACSRVDWLAVYGSDDWSFAPWLENDFPFTTGALDARQLAGHEHPRNITARGILMPLGQDVYGCFDTDLLRWSAIWRTKGETPFTMESMSQVSYPRTTGKAKKIPAPMGSGLSMTPPVAGAGPVDSIGTDSRPWSGPAAAISRGRLPVELARWQGVKLIKGLPTLTYTVAGTPVMERIKITAEGLTREWEIAPHSETLAWLLGHGDWQVRGALQKSDRMVLPPSTQITRVTATLPFQGEPVRANFPNSRWKAHLRTSRRVMPQDAGWQLSDLEVPHWNTAGRLIRVTDLAFFDNGDAAVCTFDGDVWIVSEIGSEQPVWRRFASGLFEPMAIKIIAGKIVTAGRDYLTRLHDRDSDGVADFYENLSNAFIQSEATRDYTTSFEIDEDGRFYLAKAGLKMGFAGGQNPHAGAVIRIDDDQAEVFCTGLRVPFIGFGPDGQLYGSDQQGQWVPSTPILLLEKGKRYGYKPSGHQFQNEPVTRPLTWAPYVSNPSAAGFLHVQGSSLPSLEGGMFQLSWTGLMQRVYRNGDQGALVNLPVTFDAPLLQGRVHPKNGKLYLVGLGIRGYLTQKPRDVGFFELGAAENIPANVRAVAHGLVLDFPEPLPENAAQDLGAFTIERWNYQRSAKYGSGYFKLDGSPGKETLSVVRAELLNERRTLRLALADMRVCDQLVLTWSLGANAGTAYLSPFHLPATGEIVAPTAEELASIARQPGSQTNAISVERGRVLYESQNCRACHSLDGTALVGPTFKNLYGTKRQVQVKGERRERIANDAYLKQSITHPASEVLEGYQAHMPSYRGILTDTDMASLIEFLRTLADDE